MIQRNPGQIALLAASTLTLVVASQPATMRSPSSESQTSIDYMHTVPAHPQAAESTGSIQYNGTVSGVAVTTGKPRVYLVFWGSQWGATSSDGRGSTVLSGDPNQAAPYLQRFFRGIGSGGEAWSGVMTQYCQGVPRGTTSCPASAPHVGYPTGGALAGVFVDSSRPAPQMATPQEIAAEATAAARRFGNTTAASNRNAQYFILSPAGTRPDGFPSAGFCAWHSLSASAYGDITYTNMPYLTDNRATCGQGFVNAGAAGTLDGFSIVGGHEYAETLTDQRPDAGWIAPNGEENADLCSWLTTGPGRVQNLALSTGTFAVQGTWSNDTGGCRVSHRTVA